MIIKRGIGVNIGIAIARAYIMRDDNVVIEKKILPKEKIKEEIARYKNALSKTKDEIDAIRTQILAALGKQHAKLIDAHSMILRDPLITKDVINLMTSERFNSEYALSVKIEETIKKFDKINDNFFIERKNEIIDVSRRIIFNLANVSRNFLKEIREPVVIIANNIYPSDLLNIRKSPNVLAFCTNLGSKTSHTAIFAQNMGIPAVVGLGATLSLGAVAEWPDLDGQDQGESRTTLELIAKTYSRSLAPVRASPLLPAALLRRAPDTRFNVFRLFSFVEDPEGPMSLVRFLSAMGRATGDPRIAELTGSLKTSRDISRAFAAMRSVLLSRRLAPEPA